MVTGDVLTVETLLARIHDAVTVVSGLPSRSSGTIADGAVEEINRSRSTRLLSTYQPGTRSISVSRQEMIEPLARVLGGAPKARTAREVHAQQLELLVARRAIDALISAEVEALFIQGDPERYALPDTNGGQLLVTGIHQLVATGLTPAILDRAGLCTRAPGLTNTPHGILFPAEAAFLTPLIDLLSARTGSSQWELLSALMNRPDAGEMVDAISADLTGTISPLLSPGAARDLGETVRSILTRSLGSTEAAMNIQIPQATRVQLAMRAGTAAAAELSHYLCVMGTLPTPRFRRTPVHIGKIIPLETFLIGANQHLPASRIGSLDALVNASSRLIHRLIGGTVHLSSISIIEDLSMYGLFGCRGRYRYLPKSGTGELQLDGFEVADPLRAFYKGMFTSGDTTLVVDELTGLIAVKSAMKTILHEHLHSIGCDSVTVFGTEVGTRFPGQRYFREGLAELAARSFLDEFIELSGIAARDPRIRDVAPKETYIAEMGTLAVLIHDLAGNRSKRDLLKYLASSGDSCIPLDLIINAYVDSSALLRENPTCGQIATHRIRAMMESHLAAADAVRAAAVHDDELAVIGQTAGYSIVHDIHETIHHMERHARHGTATPVDRRAVA